MIDAAIIFTMKIQKKREGVKLFNTLLAFALSAIVIELFFSFVTVFLFSLLVWKILSFEGEENQYQLEWLHEWWLSLCHLTIVNKQPSFFKVFIEGLLIASSHLLLENKFQQVSRHLQHNGPVFNNFNAWILQDEFLLKLLLLSQNSFHCNQIRACWKKFRQKSFFFDLLDYLRIRW